MEKSMFNDDGESKKSLRVRLVVDPPIADPWRTREEYIEDMKMMSNSFRLVQVSCVAAVISALAAVAIAYTTIKQSKEESMQPLLRTEQKQDQEQPQQSFDQKQTEQVAAPDGE